MFLHVKLKRRCLAPPTSPEKGRIVFSLLMLRPATEVTVGSALRILRLAGNASTRIGLSDIKGAFLRRAMELHPDRNSDPLAAAAFHSLMGAFRLCSQHVRDSGPIRPSAEGSGCSASSSGGELNAREELLRIARHYDMPIPQATSAAHVLPSVLAACAVESQAEAAVKTVCDELPIILCGRRSFRCACAREGLRGRAASESAHSLVFRLSNSLPQIVAKVVRSRRDTNRHRTSTKEFVPIHRSELGTASAPSDLAIDDLLLKPLVLVGCLVLRLRTREGCSTATESTDEAAVSVCQDLRCVLCADEPIETWVSKLATWERASFRRLVLESHLSRALSTISEELGVDPPLQAVPILALATEVVAAAASLARGLAVDASVEMHANRGTGEARLGGAESPLHCLSCSLRQHIRQILIVYSKDDVSPFVFSCGEAAGSAEYSVVRSPNACTAESILFDVTVTLCADYSDFRSRLQSALEEVARRVDASKSALSRLLECRNRLEREAGVKCFSRVFGLEAPKEKLLWEALLRNEALLKCKRDQLSFMNVWTLDSTNSSTAVQFAFDKAGRCSSEEGSFSGWCNESSEGDNVVISERELQAAEDEDTFDKWLRSVVCDSIASKEAQDLLARHKVMNVRRHPDLPLAHYLTFLRSYVTSAARSTFEGTFLTKGDRATVVDLLVANVFDIQDGHLLVPWNCDPAFLVGVLGGGYAPHTALLAA